MFVNENARRQSRKMPEPAGGELSYFIRFPNGIPTAAVL